MKDLIIPLDPPTTAVGSLAELSLFVQHMKKNGLAGNDSKPTYFTSITL